MRDSLLTVGDAQTRADEGGLASLVEGHDSIVVICTRNRSKELETCLAAVRTDDADIPVLIADSSDPAEALPVHAMANADARALVLGCQPGLARQRNEALVLLERCAPNIQFIHFIDDDTYVCPGYFSQITEWFLKEPTTAGVGGVVINQDRPRHVRAKSLFKLYSSTPGRVLTSGRNTIGHYPGSEADNPDWLPGCCMSYRASCVRGRRFDSRLEGYSWGEDFDFSFRLSQEFSLAIAPEARVVHAETPKNRLDKAALAAVRIPLLFRWVRENRRFGLRLRDFWLSVLGEIILKTIDGVVQFQVAPLHEAIAVFRAAAKLPWTGAARRFGAQHD